MIHTSKYYKYTTRVLLAVLAVGVWVLAIEHLPRAVKPANAAPPVTGVADTKKPGVENLHRINIKDADGTTRFVISNAQDSPPANVRGKTYPRSISNAAGMVFYSPDGEEIGGLATSINHGERQAALSFDFDYQPTDAIGLRTLESPDGKNWSAGLSIFDQRPYHPGPITSSEGVERISLADHNRDAELIINDPEGKPRIRIGVGPDGKPHIEMLNAQGQVVYEAKMVKVKQTTLSSPT